jgi:dipeptidyl aminopeptidase/acylaminoacyl peptidase
MGSVPSFVEVLTQGNDFYSSPRLSPDGTQLAWLTWNHPDMPWDGCRLFVAPILADGRLGEAALVAGSPDESLAQPEWSPNGVLHFVCDRTDWWNLYRWREGRVEPVTQLEAEFASPHWVFRMSNYGFDPAGSPVRGDGAGRAICTYFQNGLSRLAAVDLATCALKEIPTPYTSLGAVRVGGGKAVFLGASAQRAAAVVCLDLATGRTEELARSTQLEYDTGYISAPRPVEFPTTGGRTAHGLHYPPRNKDFAAPPGERPPVVVFVHGGPTSATTSAFRGGIQYYTSRGVAVLDVNYGGSSGYGRKYRQRLNDNWGIVDVDDCCNGAAFLASRGLVDGRRMAITGGSAGGYTVLAALTMRKAFAAGASHFGISDCEAMAKETHKYESRYLDRLIGPYPSRRDLYVERSPIHHIDGLSCPVIFFQGLEDKIVPPDQAQMMVEVLRKKRLPVALLEFEGEQHGFRKAPNIQRAMEAELYFFARVFGFEIADRMEPVMIENL